MSASPRATLDQLVAERDEWEESGAAHEYSETCPCSDCHDLTAVLFEALKLTLHTAARLHGVTA